VFNYLDISKVFHSINRQGDGVKWLTVYKGLTVKIIDSIPECKYVCGKTLGVHPVGFWRTLTPL
jgi:hypothetical protein